MLNYLSKLAAKGSKTGKYFFQTVMDFLTAQFLTFGRRMRKLLEALWHQRNLCAKKKMEFLMTGEGVRPTFTLSVKAVGGSSALTAARWYNPAFTVAARLFPSRSPCVLLSLVKVYWRIWGVADRLSETLTRDYVSDYLAQRSPPKRVSLRLERGGLFGLVWNGEWWRLPCHSHAMRSGPQPAHGLMVSVCLWVM